MATTTVAPSAAATVVATATATNAMGGSATIPTACPGKQPVVQL